MKLGNIINGEHPLLKSISSMEESLGEPTLIVGFSCVNKLYPETTLLNKQVAENIFYCLSEEEDPTAKNEIDKFISHCFVFHTKSIECKLLFDIKQLPDEDCFYYQKDNLITITTNNCIFYSHKEISLFFNRSFNIEERDRQIYSWSNFKYIQAYLKTCNCYQSLDQLRYMLKPYGDIDLYFGALCFKWLNNLKEKADIDTVKVWQRAYSVQEKLSNVKIKIDINKIKANIDIPIFETIYEKVIDKNYLIQHYNGTDKVTGRMFAANDNFSLQSLAKDHRNIVIAETGKVLIEFDYKQFEFSLLAQLANFELKADPHEQLANFIFHDKSFREQAKAINYSIIYGKSVDKIIKELNLNDPLVKERLEQFVEPLRKLSIKLEKEFKKKGYILNYFGRNIHPEKQHALLNNYIQSTAADFLIQKLEILFELYPTEIVLQNHDSILMHIEDKLETIKQIKTILETPIERLCGRVEMEMGKNWKNISVYLLEDTLQIENKL